MASDTWVLVAVVAVRAVVPLGLFRFPLPAILACLVVDALDRTVFQALGAVPSDYEGYDKAMDSYYLALAYLAALRSWTSVPAFRTARFLFLYRLVGTAAYELSAWGPMLLVFPNTFEYFFIAVEVVRTRWRSERIGTRAWIVTAAAIWVLVKLPQEWWIHVAHLDVTDFVAAHPWWGWPPLLAFGPALVVVWTVVARRLPPPEHPFRLVARPVPEAVEEPQDRAAWVRRHRTFLSWPMAEKVALVVLLVVVYGQVLPGTDATELELFVASVVVAAANVAVSLAAARRHWTPSSMTVLVVTRVVLNLALIALLDAVATPASVGLDVWHALLLLTLVVVVTTFHDRYLPVHGYRTSRRRRADLATRQSA